MTTVRTFIAIGLTAPVRESLGRYQQALGAPGARYVKWVNPEGIHLTLKFLGNVDEPRIPEMASALGRAVAGSGSFRLQTGAPGAFPSLRNPRVLWVGLDGDMAALQSLFRLVEEALAGVGFPREGRPFAPHLTLGRLRETATRANREALAQGLAGLPTEDPLGVTVQDIHVMKSQLAPAGATYTSLHSIPLSE